MLYSMSMDFAETLELYPEKRKTAGEFLSKSCVFLLNSSFLGLDTTTPAILQTQTT